MKRKPQNKIDKDKINILEPINITLFGGLNDPCFGKFHDPKVYECGICGDAEICSIICAQKQPSKKLESSDNIFVVEDYLEQLFNDKIKLSFSYLLFKVSKKFDIEKSEAELAIFKVIDETLDYKKIKLKGKKYIKKG